MNSLKESGTPTQVLRNIQAHVRRAAPEPEILRLIGEESQRNGTDKLCSREIDQLIKSTRARMQKRPRF